MSPRNLLRRRRRKPSVRPMLEGLEDRVVLTATGAVRPILQVYHAPGTYPEGLTPSPIGILPQDNGFTVPVGYTPDQIRTAYGINNIAFGSITGDGTGQTIAIVDAYDDPAFVDSSINGSPNPAFSTSDLAEFDKEFGLPDPPSFTKYNQNGQTTNLPGTDPAGAGNILGTWEMEEALDIEWAHAIAPGASIDLVEANTDTNNNDLFTAVATAASLPGVSVVSMSWGLNEYNGEQSVDSTFTTPSGHPGVTFVAASGDSGSPGYYPAYSPNVLAVGGTTLNLNADNTYQSETAWSGSGGGTSQYEPEPAYQGTVQSTGKRTIPDVAFNADPNTGVAVYDSYDDTDNSGPWLEIGGTSAAAPPWAALIAIADQGRVAAGGSPLDGPTETLPALYSLPASDFHDITQGSNGGFRAGPGYDEVTGLGTPVANQLVPDLLAYGTATHLAVTNQPPANVIAGDSFGIIVAAEDAEGGVDPEFSGTVTLSLTSNPGGSSLGGNLTVTASHGLAVFDGLTLNNAANGYQFTVTTSGFPAVRTATFNVIANPNPGSGTFYPVGTDSSLRAAIAAADSNGFASNTIVLSSGKYVLTDPTAGQVVIQNTSSLPSKTLTIVGAGETSTVIQPDFYPWQDRIFEIVGTAAAGLTVVFQDLSIEGGNATGGGILGGNAALGGGLLIDGGTVAMTRVAVSDNEAQGARGNDGQAGGRGQAGQSGGDGGDGHGGGIYLAAGTLTLNDDVISNNIARGGGGGSGGAGGNQFATKSAVAQSGAAGGAGGNGGTAAGGGVYVAGGTLVVSGGQFTGNQALGGAGGQGGKGADGILGKPGGAGGDGGKGGPASGGAFYLAQGTLTLNLSTLATNSAVGGAGGAGGSGGPGSSLLVSSSAGLSLSGGSIFSGTAPGGGLSKIHGGPGGTGGVGGAGAAGAGGGIYVGGGHLTLFGDTLSQNQALGGLGGVGGKGGTAGMGSLGTLLGTGLGGSIPLGGSGGTGGQGGSGSGGGVYLAGGTLTILSATLSANAAQGGAGGTGGAGGNGAFAGGLSGITGLIRRHGGAIPLTGSSPTILPTGIGGAASGGPGGDGGDGGQGQGGGLYVAAGTLTLVNDTVAKNSVQGGASGSGGSGGKGGSNGLGNGAPGQTGNPGDSDGGGLYINGGSVSFFNSTVALNTQTGTGQAGGVLNAGGVVVAASTLFAGNGSVDYSGTISAVHCLFQTTPVNGASVSGNNLVGVNPLLDPNGLQNHGGPTQTIALEAGSPAFGAGSNPESLFADQRGAAPRSGSSGTDIGAVQHDATADTTPPTASLNAPAVTVASSGSQTTYDFSITFSDNVAIAATTLAGSVVEIVPPGGGAPITATVIETSASGSTDQLGDAPRFVVTYQITPPGGAWTAADVGTYSVTLGGARITDLAGNPVPVGTLGTFVVNAPQTPLTLAAIPNQTVPAGQSLTLTLQGSGPTGLTLTYSASVDSLAYHLKSTLGLYEAGSFYTNYYGGGEQWVAGTGGIWYYILPSGGFYRWSGNGLTGTLIAQLGPSYDANPSLLVNAQPGQGQATVSISGAQLTITPDAGFAGILYVTASVSDGAATASQTFTLTVAGPTLAAIPNQTVAAGQSLTLTLQGSDPAGLSLTYSASVDSLAYHLKSTLGLHEAGSFYTNYYGGGEQWVMGTAGWYYILPSGAFYLWSGSGLTGTLIAQLGPSYNANPSLLVNAQPGQGQATVSVNGAQLTITPDAGFTGILYVTASVSDGHASASQMFTVTVT